MFASPLVSELIPLPNNSDKTFSDDQGIWLGYSAPIIFLRINLLNLFTESNLGCDETYVALLYIRVHGCALSQNLLELLGYASDFRSTSLIIMVNIKFYKQ